MPDNFSVGIFLRFIFGRLHFLDNFIDDILTLEITKSCLGKQIKVERSMTQNLNESAAIALFQMKNKEKFQFPISFWLSCSK